MHVQGKSDESTGQHGEGVDTESAAHIKCLPLYGVAHSLGGGVLTLVESKRPGTFAVRLSIPVSWKLQCSAWIGNLNSAELLGVAASE